MLHSVQIVVLHTVKYRDSGMVIRGYSDNGGRQSFFLRNVKGPKNGASIQQLHPLSIIDAQLSSYSKGEMKTIKEFTPASPLQEIRCNLQKSTIAMFMSELISKTVQEVEQNSSLYDFITRSVLSLEKLEEGFADFHLFFMVALCRHIGYDPLLSENALSQRSSSILAEILSKENDLCQRLSINGSDRYNFIREMCDYISNHSGCKVELLSLEVLHDVYGLN